jgi:hypothetical protein
LEAVDEMDEADGVRIAYGLSIFVRSNRESFAITNGAERDAPSGERKGWRRDAED